METFEVPAMLGLPAGIKVLATEIYLATRVTFTSYNLATTFSMVYLMIAGVGLTIYFRATRSSERYAVISGKGFRPTVIQLGAWRFLACAVALLIIFIIVLLPVLVILYASFLPWMSVSPVKAFKTMSLANYQWLLTYDVGLRAFQNNLIVGAGSATLAVFLTSIIAWISIRTRIRGRKLLDALAFCPIAFPGLVFGLALMWLYLTIPVPIYGTLWILLVAYTGKYMPICMRASSTALTQVHKELEEASEVSGASWWQSFSRIVVPLVLPGLFVGWVYVFTLSFKVLSLPILLSSVGTEVVPVAIFDLSVEGEYTRLAALGMVLIVMITLVTLTARRAVHIFSLEP